MQIDFFFTLKFLHSFVHGTNSIFVCRLFSLAQTKSKPNLYLHWTICFRTIPFNFELVFAATAGILFGLCEKRSDDFKTSDGEKRSVWNGCRKRKRMRKWKWDVNVTEKMNWTKAEAMTAWCVLAYVLCTIFGHRI